MVVERTYWRWQSRTLAFEGELRAWAGGGKLRRQPEALAREGKLKKLIAEVNASAKPDRRAQELGAVLGIPFEEPAGQTSLDGGLPTNPAGVGLPSDAAESLPKHCVGEAEGPAYLKLLERIKQTEQEREDLVFKGFLAELFGEIALVNSTATPPRRDLDLPSPPPLYRLRFDRSGAARFERSPLHARVDEVYQLLGGLDLSRLRRCSGCETRKLFWATRVDQVGCGKVCSNRIRVRNFNYRAEQAVADPVPADPQTVLCSIDYPIITTLET
jgi:hypothetical protein